MNRREVAGPAIWTADAPGQRGYLDFIDGLRAISILAVVAFHVGFPAPSGGFFGVDIFFVISGFLIIGQIVADCEAGTFRFGRFWARRVLRILPSYLLVIFACILLSLYVLVAPGEMFEFSEQVMWSAGMAMNSWLIRHVGYFDTDSNVKELLHLWSLAVEEQFYIVAPIAIWAFFVVTGWIKRIIPRWLLTPAAMTAVFMWSLGLAMRIGPAPSSPFFYHTEHRIWEFVAGGAAAMLVPQLRMLPRSLRELGALVGAACIVCALFVFGLLDSFPSWQSVVPVLGAALVLGMGAAGPNRLTSVLAWRPLRGIGLVSYAWYLWHWPLMSFAYIEHFADRDPVLRAVCAGVSFLLAVLTYLLLERPLREHRRRLAKAMPWRIVLIGIAACAATMTVGWEMNSRLVSSLSAGIPATLAPARQEAYPECEIPAGRVDECLARRAGRSAVLLVGDSHAGAASFVFQEEARKRGWFLMRFEMGGCSPFLDTRVIGPDDHFNSDCSTAQDAALQLLKNRDTGIRVAIIDAQWLYHTVGDRPRGAAPTMDDRAGFIASMDHTLDVLAGLGASKSLVLGPIPLYNLRPATCLIRADRTGVSRDVCAQRTQDAVAERAKVVGWLQAAVEARPDARYADPIKAFCDPAWCRPNVGDTVLYFDYSHLNDVGVEAVYSATKPGFDWLFGAN